jgi:hypothetical protein
MIASENVQACLHGILTGLPTFGGFAAKCLLEVTGRQTPRRPGDGESLPARRFGRADQAGLLSLPSEPAAVHSIFIDTIVGSPSFRRENSVFSSQDAGQHFL